MPRSPSEVVSDSALRVRVDALAEDVHLFRGELRETRVTISREMAEISAKIDTGQRPNYQALGVILTGFIALGALAYWPIRETTQSVKTDLQTLSERVVFIRRYEGEQKVQNDRLLELAAIQRNLQDSLAQARETIAKGSQAQVNLNERLNAISQRLAQVIRDMQKANSK